MKTSRLLILLAVIACFLLPASNASAQIPLNALVAGESITVFDKLFDNWAVTQNSITGADSLARNNFDLNNILVSPDLSRGPSDPGLRFTTNENELNVTADANVTTAGQLSILFDVNVQNGHYRWVDNELVAQYQHTDDNVVPNHSAHVHEFLYDTRVGDNVFNLFADKDSHLIHDTATGFVDQSGLVEFVNFSGRLSGTVRKDITLEAHSLGEGAGVISFTQHFSQAPVPPQTPEPSTFILAVLGLLGLSLVRRGRRR
jgi:hypothetical protein